MAGDMDLLGDHLGLVSLVVFGTFVFALGAMIGSFLNVVVHRLPRGRSPAKGRSHCPACGSRILARDNIPVLSWLLLRGRCRACRAPISCRYPLVEAGCGLMFLGLAFLEIVAGDPSRRPWWTPLDARPDRVVLFLYQAFAACAILTWWLIELDGGSIPWRQAVGVLTVAAIVPMLLPAVHPVAADAGMVAVTAFGQAAGGFWPNASGEWFERGLLVSVVGAAAAILVAAILERFSGPSQAVFLGLVLAGVVLGWQGAVWVGVAAAIVPRIAARGGPKIVRQPPLDGDRAEA
jgi:leader peptidase (prepilin peptidase)/N-methyltransferase